MMDIEEVTKWLSIMKANLNSFPEVSNAKKIEALAEAIRLLKNEESKEPSSSEKPNRSEIPTSSDCVDRHSVDLLAYRYLKEPTDNHVAFYEDFLDLPSVTPIRPKGHWIYDKSFANWVCSKCGKTPKTIGYVGTGAFMAEHFKYCNHCGAEMEEVEE